MSPPKKDTPPDEPGTTDGNNAGAEDVAVDVDALTAQLAERDARIAELEQAAQDGGGAGEEALAAATARVSELEEALGDRDTRIAELELQAAATPKRELIVSGETKQVTYLGRPHLLNHDEEGRPTEADVYSGTDPWSESGDVTLAVGETARVSAEKAAQLAADHPDAFDIE